VLPLVVLALMAAQGNGRNVGWMAVGLAAFGLVVMAFSRGQVRRGKWRHVDASGKQERGSLNRFLLALLTGATLLCLLTGAPRPLILGLGLSAAMLVVAMATAHWCKLSLHLAFVTFAAMLLASLSWWLGMAGLLFAAAVAWSRLRLQRHVPRDLVVGACTGILAGLAFIHFTQGGAG
jgi:PAP2 superfamily.